MKILFFNILREYSFRDRVACQSYFLSKFYPFIDNPSCGSPEDDFLNLSQDWINVNRDLTKSIEDCKHEHNLIPA